MPYVNLLEMLYEAGLSQGLWKQAPPCSSALTKARDRVGFAPLKQLYERSAQEWQSQTQSRGCDDTSGAEWSSNSLPGDAIVEAAPTRALRRSRRNRPPQAKEPVHSSRAFFWPKRSPATSSSRSTPTAGKRTRATTRSRPTYARARP